MLKRAIWKVPYISPIFLSSNLLEKKAIKSKVRNSLIPSVLQNKSCYLYNGKKFLPIAIKVEMVGHKAGEFSWTKSIGYRKKKKDKKKKVR